MRRNAALTVIVTVLMAAWMTGFAHAQEAETCEGYEHKEEGLQEDGSGTVAVTADGTEIGSITWNNDGDPESISWEVEDGYSLDVCVAGGGATATGSGQTGSLTPPQNEGGESPAVSHFAWTVATVAESGGNGGNGENGSVTASGDGDEAQGAAAGGGDADAQVAAADDAAAQVEQVPEGGTSAGGGSTSGMENAGLFVAGLILIAAAGPALMFARRAGRRV